MTLPFNSIYRHQFIRVAVCIPRVRLGNPSENAARTIALAQQAHDTHTTLVLFPELGVSGYSNEDLFQQDALLDATSAALAQLVEASRSLRPLLLVGAPLRFEQKLFNCAIAIHQGRVLYVSRFGYRPSRVVFLAEHTWGGAARGTWPEDVPEAERRAYDRAAIKRWLAVFLRRFFETSQFKRSALPNAPKVGSGGSLSPRSDWRAPSDGHADAWLLELEREVPD